MLKINYTTLLLAVGLFVVCTSCHPFQRRELIGSWKGAAILEDGDSLKIDPSLVTFQFTSKGGYTFTSTLNYRESGTYYLDAHLLHTQDTSRSGAPDKVVELLLLDKDSLHMRMQEHGKERIVKLSKERK